MITVAYLANEFPAEVEHYVGDEIEELRHRGLDVVTGSVRGPENGDAADVVLLPVRLGVVLRAMWMFVTRGRRLGPLIGRILFRGSEGMGRRIKALAHTWLGVCYAVRLKGRKVEHIHAHHGYFGSWIAMTAAKVLEIPFSLTLHGSDLLQHGAYLDVKLRECAFCLTISEYNRRYICERYAGLAGKVLVSRLGVDVPELVKPAGEDGDATGPLRMVAVGRLHPVKDHAFLIAACARLQRMGVNLRCEIAGDGPERARLEDLIRTRGLRKEVVLLGHVRHEEMGALYDRADVVVLTSRSEGIPLVLMEAMARGKIVVAPAITGIPELVIPGQTGFLYEPGSMDALVERLAELYFWIASTGPPGGLTPRVRSKNADLEWIRHAARVQVRANFNRRKNLESFGELFLRQVTSGWDGGFDEDSVLQQVQLSVQRDGGVPV